MTYPQDAPASSAEPDGTGLAGRFPLFDVATGLLLTACCAVFLGSDVAVLASLGMTLPWIIRRGYPIAALVIATVASFAHLALAPEPSVAIVAVPLLIYSYARWFSRNLARLSLGIGIVGAILGPLRWLVFNNAGIDGLPAALITSIACAGVVCLAYVVGRFRRERAERAAQALAASLERERLLRSEQEQRARVAAIDERNRIARELHDIVAHSLSVIVVQAEGGRALAAKRPEQAPEVLSTIARTSREALQEIGQMVGLLRSGGTPGSPAIDGRPGAGGPEGYLPTPGLEDLGELVSKSNEEFTLTEYGDRPAVSQALGLSVYRIVQESLTNVLKHAGQGARAAVGVTYARHGIGIRVVDDGAASPALLQSPGDAGHGLRGMWERVAIHGGTFAAHPRPAGGFEVLAWLPYPPTDSRQLNGQPVRQANNQADSQAINQAANRPMGTRA